MSNYANILKQSNNQQNTIADTRDDRVRTDSKNVKLRRKRLVVNYVPPKRTSSYDSWEFAYFRELMQLRNVFIDGLASQYPHLIDYMTSPQFFHKFCRFIRKNSSGYITPHLEELNEVEQEDYWFYTLKRKDL